MYKLSLFLILASFSLSCSSAADKGGYAVCDLHLECGPGMMEVSTCTDESTCQVQDTCAGIIRCEPDPSCENVAPPTCEAGYSPGEVCEKLGDQHCVYESSECHEVICNPDPISTCLAIPVCQEGFFEVDKCKLSDESCIEVTECQTTISCTPQLDCRAAPSCEGDEIAFENKETCEAGSENCRQNYICGTTIWCGGAAECTAPSCENESSECQDNEQCIEQVGCGLSIICEK